MAAADAAPERAARAVTAIGRNLTGGGNLEWMPYGDPLRGLATDPRTAPALAKLWGGQRGRLVPLALPYLAGVVGCAAVGDDLVAWSADPTPACPGLDPTAHVARARLAKLRQTAVVAAARLGRRDLAEGLARRIAAEPKHGDRTAWITAVGLVGDASHAEPIAAIKSGRDDGAWVLGAEQYVALARLAPERLDAMRGKPLPEGWWDGYVSHPRLALLPDILAQEKASGVTRAFWRWWAWRQGSARLEADQVRTIIAARRIKAPMADHPLLDALALAAGDGTALPRLLEAASREAMPRAAYSLAWAPANERVSAVSALHARMRSGPLTPGLLALAEQAPPDDLATLLTAAWTGSNPELRGWLLHIAARVADGPCIAFLSQRLAAEPALSTGLAWVDLHDPGVRRVVMRAFDSDQATADRLAFGDLRFWDDGAAKQGEYLATRPIESLPASAVRSMRASDSDGGQRISIVLREPFHHVLASVVSHAGDDGARTAAAEKLRRMLCVAADPGPVQALEHLAAIARDVDASASARRSAQQIIGDWRLRTRASPIDWQMHADLTAIGGWWWNDADQIRRADAVLATLEALDPQPPAKPPPGSGDF